MEAGRCMSTKQAGNHASCGAQGCMYNAVVASSDGRHLYACGSDGKIRELEEVAGTGTQVSREVDAGCVVTALALQPG